MLSVLAYHLFPSAAIGGYLGVDVFFVISGFLITTLLIGEHAKAGGISVPRFWLRRARRLLPALALVVLAGGTAAAFIGGDVLVRLGSQVVGAATFSSNWVYIAQGSSYFDEATPELFRTFWSLAVEEQFYLVWPGLLLLLLLLRWQWARVAVVVLAAAASAVAMAVLFTPPGDPTRVYYGTDTHSFGLAIGAALALLMSARMPGRPLTRALAPLGALAVGVLVVLVLVMPADDPFVTRGGLALAALLTAVAFALGWHLWVGDAHLNAAEEGYLWYG
ncbi:MAG: acyltransferase, partial [Rhodoglobus sp.]